MNLNAAFSEIWNHVRWPKLGMIYSGGGKMRRLAHQYENQI